MIALLLDLCGSSVISQSQSLGSCSGTTFFGAHSSPADLYFWPLPVDRAVLGDASSSDADADADDEADEGSEREGGSVSAPPKRLKSTGPEPAVALRVVMG